MNKKELINKIEYAYNKLSESVWKYRTQAMVVRAHEFDLEGAKLALFREGKVEGKNQTERDACLAGLLEGDIGQLEMAKQEEADLYMKMELNKLWVEKYRTILRVYELSEVEDELA
jgi:hypothetical protein